MLFLLFKSVQHKYISAGWIILTKDEWCQEQQLLFICLSFNSNLKHNIKLQALFIAGEQVHL